MPDCFEPLSLPNGVHIANRICKAAMEENLCDAGQIPGQKLERLYQHWSVGGVGLILTGNVMVSADALTGPGGVVLHKSQPLEPFKRWASAAKSGGAKVFMQINHPGRQVYKSMGEQAVAPSAIALNIPGFSSMFSQPKALSSQEIAQIIQQFTDSAVLAEQAGFDGCQIHAAHGYLISQFLSPLTNIRNDEWGGSLANRARLLFKVVQSVRANVSSNFCVSVKLNSADFQKGGFDEKDAKWVIEQLNTMQVDLLELSGGNYESPAMQGSEVNKAKDSTQIREAYFIEFAQELAQCATMPVMVTGGIRKLSVAQGALHNENAEIKGIDMIGIARALAFNPQLVNDWQQGRSFVVDLPSLKWKNKTFAALGMMAITKDQLNRLSKQEPSAEKEPSAKREQKPSKLKINPILAIIKDRIKTKLRTRRYRQWRRSS